MDEDEEYSPSVASHYDGKVEKTEFPKNFVYVLIKDNNKSPHAWENPSIFISIL